MTAKDFMSASGFNTDYRQKNFPSAPKRWDAWIKAMDAGLLLRARKIIEVSEDVSPQEAAFALHALTQYFSAGSSDAGLLLGIGKQIAKLGCFKGADRCAMKRDPVMSALGMARKCKQSGAASEWIALALAIAGELAPSPGSQASMFSLFLNCGHQGALRSALGSGVAVAPEAGELEKLMLSQIRLAYGKSSGKEFVAAASRLDALLNARMPPPSSLSAREAHDLLETAAARGAGREAMSFLLSQSGDLLTSEKLVSLGAICAPSKKKVLSPPLETSLRSRPLGAILRSSAWTGSARDIEATRICKAAIARGESSVFMAAASFCDWGALSAEAANKFGAAFLAQLEKSLLAKAGPIQSAPRASAGRANRL